MLMLAPTAAIIIIIVVVVVSSSSLLHHLCSGLPQRPPNWLHSSLLVHLSGSINIISLRLISNQVTLRNLPTPATQRTSLSFSASLPSDPN